MRHPVALLVLVLTVMGLVRLGAQAPPAAPRPGFISVTTAVGQDGTRYLYEISLEQLNKLPPWDQRATPEPPLSMSAAKKAGEAWLISRSPDVKTFELTTLFLIRLNPANVPGNSCRLMGCWYYRLVFDPVVGNRRLSGAGDFTVVVFLDGSIAEPRVDDRPVQPTAATPGGSGPFRIGRDIPPPQQTKRSNPIYPPEAQKARVQGTVIVEATIGVNGKVLATRILRSIPELDQAAVDAVKQWEYTPTLLDGKPVSVIMTVTVNFILQ